MKLTAAALLAFLVPSTALAQSIAPTCGLQTTSASFNGTGGPILNGSSASFTCTVAGLPSTLWDVNLTTAIAHAANFDLDVTLTSPAGTTVTITTDNGGFNANGFNGTLWDDNVNAPVTDAVFTNGVAASALSPEGRLGAFRGENPNGTWTLRIVDDAAPNVGTLNSWSLALSALSSLPTPIANTFVRTPNLALPDNATTNDTVNVSGVGSFISRIELYTEFQHPVPADLDVRLISPAGTAVTVTTDGGGSFANVFNGTFWTPSSTIAVTDLLFSANVVVPIAGPEGSFDNFVGQNPNGVWTLQITDDAANNLGVLARWELRLSTSSNPNAPAPSSFTGTNGVIPEAGAAQPTVFTTVASGLSGVLWDVDLTTAIVHGLNADIDMTLTSPAGTVVTITTDNGFTNNVFNGTTWDDNVNDPVTDRFFTSGVAATPLSPEGRLSRLRGENPNGLWTLTLQDDLQAISGSLTSWSITLTTVPVLQGTTTTTLASSPNVPIPEGGTFVDPIVVSGTSGPIEAVRVYVELQHTVTQDIDVTLRSPAGTIVVLTTDSGGFFDNVLDGTLFDARAATPISDFPFVDLVPAALASPEGSFDNFVGQNANGTWQLTVGDDFVGSVGQFVRWELTVETCGAVPPLPYCTPNVSGTTNGCQATISASSNPSVSQFFPCTISVASVEGAKTGILFYGVSGATVLPWCSGGSSFFCVKSPTQRTGTQDSGGTANQCNGAFNLNWDAFQNANPTAIGQPWASGDKLQVQGWFRDPPACKTTFLSQALELTYVP